MLSPSLVKVLSNPLLLGLSKALSTKLYLVGGSVREGFQDNLVTDLDCASILTPDEVIKRLGNTYRVIPTGITHGTVRILLSDNESLELTTFRKPTNRNNSEFSETIEEDLSGRDFTINALAIEIESKKIIDPFNGIKHLNENKLVAVGKAEERFREDPLRIIRGIRFGHCAGRIVENEILLAISSLKELLQDISIERIRDELDKIIQSPHPDLGILAFRDLSLLPFIIPEFLECVGFEQNEFHTEDVFEHTITVLRRAVAISESRILRFSALFHDIGKPKSLSFGENGRRHFFSHENIGAEISEEVLTRLRYGKDEVKRITRLVKHHMRPIDCGPSGVRRLFRDLEDDFDLWRLLKISDKPPIETDEVFLPKLKEFDLMVEKERDKIKDTLKLAINGDDLQALGISPGPNLGAILKDLSEKVIEDPSLNVKEILLGLVKK